MTSIKQAITRKRYRNRDALGMSLGQLTCFGRAGENGLKVPAFYEDEKAKLLNKKIATLPMTTDVTLITVSMFLPQELF